MLFTIDHETAYSYKERVRESYTVCHLQPLSDLTQYCTGFDLRIEPPAQIFVYRDRFGNEVHHFDYLANHDALTISARSTVVTARASLPQAPVSVEREALIGDAILPQLYDFMHESVYIVFGPALRNLSTFLGEPGDDLAAYFIRAGEAIHELFAYDRDATGVHTIVDEAVELRSGVCQDFAHVYVALCRLHGIPARYVSGYIHTRSGDDVLGAEASHAWCEAYLPPYGWVGFDPTNARLIDDDFVKIAVGRDYRDVSPVRGVYKGASQGLLSVNVAVEALTTTQ
jgi:transglutaminase-like putative cysteine protease